MTLARRVSYDRRSMKILEQEFTEGGFRFRQISRDGDIAIYEKQWTGKPDASIGYEVIVVKSHRGFWLRGHYSAPAEMYPSSNSWGDLGWTKTTKEAAFEKAREVANEREIRKMTHVTSGTRRKPPETS